MEKQLIITVGREFGSGGHEIAKKLAEHYQLPLYDNNILKNIGNERNLDIRELERYDENPKNPFLARTVRGYSNSPEENTAQMQFEYIKKKADAGESFVIVGRCAESILRDNPNRISLFILGDMEQKILRIMERHDLSREKAQQMIEQHDKKRKWYHNHYCEVKWGDSRNYDLSINSSRLGIEETARMIIRYIDQRLTCMYTE